MKNSFILLVVFLICQVVFSQPEYIVKLKSEADKFFADGNLPEALLVYEKLIKADSLNPYYNYQAAVCHTNLRRNLNFALECYKKAEKNQKEYPSYYYNYGMAYMYQHDYKQAMVCFNLHKEANNEKKGEETSRLLEMCISGMELINHPLKITYTNMGPVVNSTMDECFPFVPEDESYIIFSSNKRYDPVYKAYDENVYISYSEKSGWTFPAQLRNVSTYENEYPTGISHCEKFIPVCTHETNQFSEIQILKKKGKSIKVDETNPLHAITMSKKWVDGMTMNEEMNIMIVSARYDNTLGGSDLYVLKKLPDGTWSLPRNLGTAINTPYDECSPQLSSDGTTLYFSSKGHNSIGGFDLFVSFLNEIKGEWTKPKNLGYPVNTSSDNLSISFSRNRKFAYVSSFRNDGFGGMDLYRINFLDVDDPCTLITGYIGVEDSTGVHKWSGSPYDLNITVYDNNGNVYGNYTYNSYLERFVAILSPGKYNLSIESDGFKTHQESLEIMERNLFIPEIDKEFVLYPKKP